MSDPNSIEDVPPEMSERGSSNSIDLGTIPPHVRFEGATDPASDGSEEDIVPEIGQPLPTSRRRSAVNWNFHSFGRNSGHSHLSSQPGSSRRASEKSIGSNGSHRPSQASGNTGNSDEPHHGYGMRRASMAAAAAAGHSVAGAARRASSAAAYAVRQADPLRPKGNPLSLEIGETRRISSAGYARPGAFDGRRTPQTPSPRHGSIVAVDFLRKASIAYERNELKEDPTDFIIQRIASRDDIEHMAEWKRILYRINPLFVILTTAAYWVYFALRVRFTRDAERAADKVFWMAWAFIAVETGVCMPMLLHRLWALHIVGARKRPKLRIIGLSVPSVDVVITCCKEEDDLVLDTAKAACNIDYPIDRFRVIICDDGNSANLRKLTEITAANQFDNLYYRSRPKYPGVPHHFKAGNLNYALEETHRLPGGGANFIAALDADMIPERDWLRALMPHMLQDPKCSMACPPQLFYNVPRDDPLCQSLDAFVHISEPIKDAMGVAWCTGSGYVMRRAALDDIGGFPIGSLAEDVCCSSMLLGSGWNTAFVHEPLQFGTVPDSYSSHLKQRTRWTIGTVQTSLKLRFSIYGPLVKHMTFPQRLCGFVYTISSLFTMFLVASMFTAPIVLVSGGNLVPYRTLNQLRWLIRTCWASLILNRMNEMLSYLPSGYRTGQRDARGMMWMAPYHALSVIRSFLLPKWLGGKVAVFTSSGSQASELNERDAQLRAPLWRRLKVIIWDCQAYMHCIYIAFVVAAVTLSTYRVSTVPHHLSTQGRLIQLLTHAGWPPLIWLTCTVSCWVPISYAIAPPSMPDREGLLDRDPKTGVAYPSKWAKSTKTSWVTWSHEAFYTFLTIYTTLAFIFSFFIHDVHNNENLGTTY